MKELIQGLLAIIDRGFDAEGDAALIERARELVIDEEIKDAQCEVERGDVSEYKFGEGDRVSDAYLCYDEI